MGNCATAYMSLSVIITVNFIIYLLQSLGFSNQIPFLKNGKLHLAIQGYFSRALNHKNDFSEQGF